MSDIFIIGLQEMVMLNTNQVIKGKDKERTSAWQRIFQEALDKNKEGVQYIPII